MIQLLIVADDFTGALDTGVQLSKQGCRTSVTTRYPPDFSQIPEHTQVLVADTQSRHLPPEEAYIRTYRWFEAAKGLGRVLLYKKTDSTMRGNIGAELQAAISGSGREKLLFVPALPQLGRTTRQGVVYIDGIPLEQTPFASDPFTPVCSSSLREIILHTAPELRVAVTKPARLLEDYHSAEEKSVLAVDAADITQLQEIALTSYAFREQVVFAGCAGFAQMLPCMLRHAAPAPRRAPRPNSCLIVCGSVNQIAVEQIQYAERLGISSILLQPYQYLDEAYWQSAEGQLFLSQLVERQKHEKCLILKTVGSEADILCARRYAVDRQPSGKQLHLQIADNLGNLTARVIRAARPELITVFGGDTLFGILRNLGVDTITPERELLPGVVQSVLSSSVDCVRVVSKAGGFGGPSLVEAILREYQLLQPEKAKQPIS